MIKRRHLHLAHRWLGIGLGLFVLLWFCSGLVMLFVPYPALTADERLTHMQPLELEHVNIDAISAWKLTGISGEPDTVKLAMYAERPVYRFQAGTQHVSIWADNSEAVDINAVSAAASAQQFIPKAGVRKTDLIDHDQWSISSSLNPHRLLYRVALNDPDGHEIYVSSHTGEVVLDTHATERGWNWLGSVIHWVYFTPLRMERELWRQIVLWLSFGGIVLAILGMWIGIQRARFNRPYSNGKISPYHGWKYWHHTVGLVAGIFCISWLFSGWLSLTPFGWFSDRSLTQAESITWTGGKLDVKGIHIPRRLPKDTKELEWINFTGNLYLLGRSQGHETLLNSTGRPLPAFTAATLIDNAKHLQADSTIISVTWLMGGDAYFQQSHSSLPEKKPKILRISFDDSQHTSYYIDANTSQILISHDSRSRAYRWLFNGLHRMDIPPLGDLLWPRRIIIFVLSTGGILLTIAGIVLGWRRIRRNREVESTRS